jgi:hypothetical protein
MFAEDGADESFSSRYLFAQMQKASSCEITNYQRSHLCRRFIHNTVEFGRDDEFRPEVHSTLLSNR